ncbi:uncharacterized protein PHALS_08049 [Plasmopara halstedii]|uniref:Uncharacterized protein n=1 Tax=Plasmopara halstedii TaxID=4781 RepID=A0A0N7L8N0_PLAHL|nr:uncharacterized protein PHALS_08049 [Plasmopara halstedii]CEG50331.1 hypothetical protein PHALS_08049 [Plasmopara halstedii]|eukprot:XP_024586700.1 hypothetical protein PHALS_08049 [Plasmopara halstedii]
MEVSSGVDANPLPHFGPIANTNLTNVTSNALYIKPRWTSSHFPRLLLVQRFIQLIRMLLQVNQ